MGLGEPRSSFNMNYSVLALRQSEEVQLTSFGVNSCQHDHRADTETFQDNDALGCNLVRLSRCLRCDTRRLLESEFTSLSVRAVLLPRGRNVVQAS